jgi:hypothetical protein
VVPRIRADNWQASGVSGQGARSFYYPPKSQKCADCHMPLVDSNDPAARDGKVRSHRFAAANTALPFVNGDSVQLKAVQDFLKDGQVTVDIFGIARTSAAAVPRETKIRDGADQQVASSFPVGEESMAFGAARVHRAAGRGDRPDRQGADRRAARRVGAARGRGPDAEGRALFSGRDRRRI